MVFTADQLTEFFQNAGYLGLSAQTAMALGAEGIETPANLAEFDKDGLDAIFHNPHKPACTCVGGGGG
jgi:hypothetical protein